MFSSAQASLASEFSHCTSQLLLGLNKLSIMDLLSVDFKNSMRFHGLLHCELKMVDHVMQLRLEELRQQGGNKELGKLCNQKIQSDRKTTWRS